MVAVVVTVMFLSLWEMVRIATLALLFEHVTDGGEVLFSRFVFSEKRKRLRWTGFAPFLSFPSGSFVVVFVRVAVCTSIFWRMHSGVLAWVGKLPVCVCCFIWGRF